MGLITSQKTLVRDVVRALKARDKLETGGAAMRRWTDSAF